MMTFAAATSARGQVHVFRTWYWTKGHFRTLAPLMLLFVVLPILVCTLLASQLTALLFGDAETPIMMGLSVAVFTLILTPSAWLGHGFASAVYAALAPADEDQPRTPA